GAQHSDPRRHAKVCRRGRGQESKEIASAWLNGAGESQGPVSVGGGATFVPSRKHFWQTQKKWVAAGRVRGLRVVWVGNFFGDRKRNGGSNATRPIIRAALNIGNSPCGLTVGHILSVV